MSAPGVRELIERAWPIIDSPPEGTDLYPLGVRGLASAVPLDSKPVTAGFPDGPVIRTTAR